MRCAYCALCWLRAPEGPDARPGGAPVSGDQAPVRLPNGALPGLGSLAKNAAQVLTLFALSNLWMKRRTLLALTG